ncbi:MAG: hypothetical protein KAI43_01205 [Candidatus Aureabacteria bacterium]|nr:hypothetical protein [Candidatus Auribacterota bacterium]
MKGLRIFIFSVIFSLLIYFSVNVLLKEKTSETNFKQKVIFINNGIGKKGYINIVGMENITSLQLRGFIYEPPKEIILGGMMGNEDLFTVKGAVQAILTAKSKNDKDWEYSMTEYYLMQKIREKYEAADKTVQKLLDKEDSKYNDFTRITLDMHIRIGKNVLCLLSCYKDNVVQIETLFLRNIGGQLFQMKSKKHEETLQSLYVRSSYATGITRLLVKRKKKRPKLPF